MSWSTSLLYSALKIWNPNLLVVESVQGQWIQPTLNLIFQAITWAIGFMCVSLGLTIARVNRIDIRG